MKLHLEVLGSIPAGIISFGSNLLGLDKFLVQLVVEFDQVGLGPFGQQVDVLDKAFSEMSDRIAQRA